MRILLVGAGGFVGRHLLPALLAAGHELLLTARRPPVDAPAGVRWLALDLERLAERPDSFAWPAGVDLLINAAGTMSLDEASMARVEANGAILDSRCSDIDPDRGMVTGPCNDIGLPGTDCIRENRDPLRVGMLMLQQDVKSPAHRQKERRQPARPAEIELIHPVMPDVVIPKLPHPHPFDVERQHPPLGLIDAPRLLVLRQLPAVLGGGGPEHAAHAAVVCPGQVVGRASVS